MKGCVRFVKPSYRHKTVSPLLWTVKGREESQPLHFLAGASFSSFSCPSHLEILLLPKLFFQVFNPLR